MNLPLTFSCVTLALIALSACDRNSPSAPPSPTLNSPAAGQAAPAVTPQSGNETSTKSGSGPAEGGTAIGGMVGNLEKDGAKSGGAPASTGGDGSTPQK